MASTSSDGGASDYLRNAKFATGPDLGLPDEARSAADVLSGTAFDPTRLHPLAGITDKLDYLTLDDDKTNELPGTTYLSGLALGGAWGFREGFSRPLATPSARLRLNSILNAITRRGSWLGNSAGVLALVYNALNSSIDHYRGQHDTYGSMAAGGLSGALFKCTAGVRPMIAAATLMTGAAGAWSYVKRSI